MGFLNSLIGGAASTLGSNLVGGQKIKVKADVKGETEIAEAQADARIRQAEGQADAQIRQAKAQANIQIKQAEAQAKLETRQATLETVNSIRFDGSADDISENLNWLISMYKQLGEGANAVVGQVMGLGNKGLGKLGIGSIGLGKIGEAMKSDKEKTRDAIIEKAEYGLMKLNKLDAEMAAFFQNKIDAMRK